MSALRPNAKTEKRASATALHNVVKHARAKRVDLALVADDHYVTLTIQDNGAGFEVGVFPHLGLRSMHERAEALGGMLEGSSEPGAGTTIRAEFPL